MVAVNASTGALTIEKAGQATVAVTAAETESYEAATKDVAVTISKADPKYDIRPEVVAEQIKDSNAPQDLIKADTGTTSDGTIMYAVKNVATSEQLKAVTVPDRDASGEWTNTKPQGTHAGYYVIFYYIKGKDSNNYNDSETSWLLKNIQPSDSTLENVPKDTLPSIRNGLVYNGSEQELMTTPTGIPDGIEYRYYVETEPSATEPGDDKFSTGTRRKLMREPTTSGLWRKRQQHPALIRSFSKKSAPSQSPSLPNPSPVPRWLSARRRLHTPDHRRTRPSPA